MKGFVKLLTVCVILPICLAGQIEPERHSLYYVYTALSKAVSAPGVFEFSAMGLLDDRKIDYYDSEIKRKVPKQNWMKEKLPADYWEKGTQSRKSKEQWFKVNVNILMERMKQNNSDVHVLMWKHGCEIDRRADGSVKFVRGIDAYSYDGNDFLSFDDASMQWVAPVTEAVPTKQKWDGVPILNQYTKGYLEKECVDWLEKFREYGDKELEDIIKHSPPEVHLFTKRTTSSDTFELTCMATGFYPREIEILILKGKEVIKKGESKDVFPNGDGTHQTKLSVKAKKSDINDYGCEVSHIGQKGGPIKQDFKFDGEVCAGCTTSVAIAAVLAIILGIILIAGFILWKKGIIVFENGRPRSNFGRQPSVEVPHVRANGAENAPNVPIAVPLLANGNAVLNGNGEANGHAPNGVTLLPANGNAVPNGNTVANGHG